MGSLGYFCVIGLAWVASVLLQFAAQGVVPWVTVPAALAVLAGDVLWVWRTHHRRQPAEGWEALRSRAGFSRTAVRAARRAQLDPGALLDHALSSRPEWRAVIQRQVIDLAVHRPEERPGPSADYGGNEQVG
ncbi:MAG: hypothetical protein ACRDKW_06070 [Actinomycetota bacterium]